MRAQRGPISVSPSKTYFALSELIAAPGGANLASHQIRDNSLLLASGEIIPISYSREAKISRIDLKRAKVKVLCSAKSARHRVELA